MRNQVVVSVIRRGTRNMCTSAKAPTGAEGGNLDRGKCFQNQPNQSSISFKNILMILQVSKPEVP